MVTIFHLGVSQSDRIVWQMEELGLPYELVWIDRGPDGLMPPEYLALHPAATAPVVKDGERTITESAAILEYISHKHADGKLSVPPTADNYWDYQYWMHFNNNVQGLFFATIAMGDAGTERGRAFVKRRSDSYFRYMNERLGECNYLAGDDFTNADIMVTFNVTSLPLFGGRETADEFSNIAAYIDRIRARPAYAKAMSIAGPEAQKP